MEKTNFSLIALHILDNCSKSIRKNLKDDWYFFCTKYKLHNDKIVENPERNKVVDKLYGENICVNAIVGKNGSGKSSVMEIVYRMINNLSYVLTHGIDRPAAEKINVVRSVYAELYFESYGKIGCLSSVPEIGWDSIYFKWGNDKKIKMDLHYGKDDPGQTDQDKRNIEYISKYFCYTLVSNYAMMSLVPEDYDELTKHGGDWLDSLYMKNDGYQAAIGIEPYKGRGVINLHTQKELFNERVSALAIYTHHHNQYLFDKYKLKYIEYEFDQSFFIHKYNKEATFVGNPEKEIVGRIKKRRDLLAKGKGKNSVKTIAECIIEGYGYIDLDIDNPVIAMALSYLVTKTLSIAGKYPQYNQKYGIIGDENYYNKGISSFVKKINESGKETIWEITKEPKPIVSLELYLKHLCHEIKQDSSHITRKIMQTIKFLDAIRRQNEENTIDFNLFNEQDYRDFLDIKSGRQDDLENIADTLPPPFFNFTIYLGKENNSNNTIPIARLSTGERQFLQTSISIIYHIRNIISAKPLSGRAKYHSVTLFFDEIEICFHPEYQKKYLEKLINLIKTHGLSEKCGINIILATHSPFILSDIPQENILYLEDGRIPEESKHFVNPFCANVNDILHQPFFMKEGFMGDFAKEIVKDLYNFFTDKEHELNWDNDKAKGVIELIGEPILRDSLMKMYNSHFYREQNPTEMMIRWHEQELAKLTKKQKDRGE